MVPKFTPMIELCDFPLLRNCDTISTVAEQLQLRLEKARKPKMDCLPTKRIAANCALCKRHDGTTHLVGTEYYCGRHCPVC